MQNKILATLLTLCVLMIPVNIAVDSYALDKNIETINEHVEVVVDDIPEPEPEPTYVEYAVPKNKGFKSYMSYKCITSKSSPQYILQRDRAYTGTYGIRQVDGRYCVAVGSYFTKEIGTLIDLVLENGTVIPCIVSDQKADIDTDSQNIMTTHNGCVSEFVVDTKVLVRMAKRMGDISYCDASWNSPVKTIRVY